MSRSDSITILIIAIAAILAFFQDSQSNMDGLSVDTNSSPVQMTINQSRLQILDASYRLSYHYKRVALESLVITRNSITLVLDSAIETL